MFGDDDPDRDPDRDPDASPIPPSDISQLLGMSEFIRSLHLALVATGFTTGESLMIIGVWLANINRPA